MGLPLKQERQQPDFGPALPLGVGTFPYHVTSRHRKVSNGAYDPTALLRRHGFRKTDFRGLRWGLSLETLIVLRYLFAQGLRFGRFDSIEGSTEIKEYS